MTDDLTRRAIIAARQSSDSGVEMYNTLTTREQAIVALLRADVETESQRRADLQDEYRKREESQDRIRERLTRERDNARAQIQYVCSEVAEVTGVRVDSPTEAVDFVRALKTMADDRYELRSRAEKAEAEVERLRTATGMADELGARVTDERNEAQAAIERVRALVADVYAFNQIPEGHIHGARDHIGSAVCLAMKITSALDGTEATDA